jgi:SEC-C motif-containing protein
LLTDRSRPAPAIIVAVPDDLCPCGSGDSLDACCGPVVRGEREAATAERLMRSRYTAFALRDEQHLLRSWHPSTRPALIRFVPDQEWTRLEVMETIDGGMFDAAGAVEFQARYERGGAESVLHELSRFVRDEDGRWVYLGAVEAELA